MWNLNCPWFKWSFLSLALLATGLVAKPMQAQDGPSVFVNGTEIRGYPQDWSHRHVVFSSIGSEDEALQKGEYEHWQKVVNEPRYVIQQLKKHGEMKGPAGIDAEYRLPWNAESPDFRFGEPDDFVRMYRRMTIKSNIKTDWSEALGGPGLAAGQYPAKFNLMTTTASCGDYVVFPTGVAGSATHATIVAFNSVYSGCPLFSGGLPVVYWAYNTGNGSTATTSPTISLDGTQVAFVQTNGTTASLMLLKVAASGGTVGAPMTPSSVAVGSYRTCTAPCYTSISLGANDTASAPFYVYGTTDTIYVGDNNGKVHEVTGAFLGNPTLDPSGWPATASTTGAPALTSPVYDSGGSNRIFVTDAAGYLHSFTVAAPATVTTSGRLENNTTNVFGPPVVDSSAEKVYTFIGYSGDGGNNNPSYINIFPAAALGGTGSAAGSGFGTGVHFPNGARGGTANPTTSNMRLGSFDNLYYEGIGNTGNIYVCENGVLYQIPLATVTTSVVNTYSTPVTTPGTASACAPVTEFLGTKVATTLSAAITTTGQTMIHVTSGTNIANTDFLQIDSEIMKVSSGGGTTSLTVTRGQQGTSAATHANGAATQDIQDWLFTAVAGGASGSATNAAGCTGACVFNYQVMGASTAGTPTAGLKLTGGTSGTSGIIIDTSSTAINGDEEIYYTPLGGTSAVQVSQAALQ